MSFPDLIRAGQVFDGRSDAPLRDHVIEMSGGRVTALRPAQPGDPAAMADIAAPGFIDMQINGAADVQFNFDPTPEALARIAAGARQGGTAHLLPTFITAPGRDYLRALTAARQAMAQGVPGVLGVHLAGPFRSPRRPGIHDPAAIRPLDETDLSALTEAFPGVLLLTLAPEEQPAGAIARLSEAGVVVFAGHSEAHCDQVAGLRGATHLWNAMSQLTGRAPGLVGAVLDGDLYAGIIADGHHVAWENIRLAARVMPERLCLVTDAMLTLAGTIREFSLHGVTIRLAEGRLTDPEGTLAGAHLAMDRAVANMVALGRVGLAAALRMASGNVARALGVADLGWIGAGARASVTLLGQDLAARGVVVDGQLFEV
ncbi:MAG: N-acetylglucosamine-6-phosphate deacetylase [Paracoccus sp. (in: a-proteobacteria)]|nr:N-acetylglucosamine-6-phosphate deacetylase [Paracoccus sp. (in: a-proteobacteria)]